MAEIALFPYSSRYAWANLTPAIFANAYASFVGSSGPLNNESSRIG